jgi:uncharacterized protein
LCADTVRNVVKPMAAAAITAPKSGGQLFLQGKHLFVETIIVDDRPTLDSLVAWMRARGKERRETTWFRDADVADSSEPIHNEVVGAVAAEAEPLVVSPYVVAELDYLVATRFGVNAELAVLAELAGGAYDLAYLDSEDVRTMCKIIDRYRDQDIGVADASLVVLASSHRTRSIFTLDHQHFTVVRPVDGGRFRLLP